MNHPNQPQFAGSRPAQKRSFFLRHPLWTTVGGLAGIVGIALSVVQLTTPTAGGGPDLELAALAVGTPEQIDGTSGLTIGEYPAQPITVNVPPIDITLKNNGAKPSEITEIRAELLSSAMLKDCAQNGAGPAMITANYALQFPLSSEHQYGELQRGTQSTETDFVVKPGSVDRMQVTVGPEEQSGNDYPTVLAVRLTLIHDNGKELDLGAVALAANAEKIETQINESTSASCAEDNLTELEKLFSSDVVHSQGLDRLEQKYRELAGR